MIESWQIAWLGSSRPVAFVEDVRDRCAMEEDFETPCLSWPAERGQCKVKAGVAATKTLVKKIADIFPYLQALGDVTYLEAELGLALRVLVSCCLCTRTTDATRFVNS